MTVPPIWLQTSETRAESRYRVPCRRETGDAILSAGSPAGFQSSRHARPKALPERVASQSCGDALITSLGRHRRDLHSFTPLRHCRFNDRPAQGSHRVRRHKNGVCDKEPSVMETHLGRFFCGDAYDKSARKQSRATRMRAERLSVRGGDGSLLIKCFQCSSAHRFRTGARSD